MNVNNLLGYVKFTQKFQARVVNKFMKMGKAKRMKPSQMGTKVPLEQDIEGAKFAKSKNRNKIRLRQDDDEQVSNSL